MARSQVLLADMPALIEGLVRESLAGMEVDVLPAGAGPEALRQVDEDGRPPVVIIVADRPEADRFERDLLLPHPQAIILRVEDDGRVLASRGVEVTRRRHPGVLTPQSLIEAIESAPSWRQRFA